jgi:hypothetical protein
VLAKDPDSRPQRHIGKQILVGAFMPLVFIVPVLLAMRIIEVGGNSGVSKIVAILIGASLFVAMKAFYYWAVMRLGEKFKV